MKMSDNSDGNQEINYLGLIKNLIKYGKNLPTTKCLSIRVINLSERWILDMNPGIELYILTNNPLASTDCTFAVTFSPGTASCKKGINKLSKYIHPTFSLQNDK